MKCNILIIMCLYMTSCQLTNGRTLKSDWQPLQLARDLDCEAFPLESGEIELKSIQYASLFGEEGFVIKGKSRRGGETTYYRPLDGASLDDEARVIKWGVGARFLGTYQREGQGYFVIERVVKGFKVIELRDPISNIVAFSSSYLPKKMHSLQVQPSENGLWLVYKNMVQDVPVIELPARVMELVPGKKDRLVVRRVKKLSAGADAKYVSVNGSDLFIIWSYQENRMKAPGFRYTIIQSSAPKISVYELSEVLDHKLESWAVAKHQQGVLLAYISGDTLIWENASLELRQFDFRGDQVWSHSQSIENEHVGDPVLISQVTRSFLVLPKWLDGESTIAVAKVGRGEKEDLGFHGIFREGSFVYSGLSLKGEENPFVIRQYPSGYVQKHELCEIDL